MKQLMEDWREWKETQEANQFVNDLWEGKFLTTSPLIEEVNGEFVLNNRLDEGLWDFMKSVQSWGKGKYQEFQDWTESKLMKVVDAGLEKLQSFLEKGKELTRSAEGKTKELLVSLKIFNKNTYRNFKNTIQTLQKPEWLALAATLLSMLLQKIVKMGMNKLLDVVSGGTSQAARAVSFIRENYEKFQEFVEMIMEFLDPKGILDTIENLEIFKDAKEKLAQFKKDSFSNAIQNI
ncbi:MAG: hypothetical protein HOJ16_06600 [Candidatus Peribacter sp.]|nr:hypothetical protein [Candidatus Peribacter sp.]